MEQQERRTDNTVTAAFLAASSLKTNASVGGVTQLETSAMTRTKVFRDFCRMAQSVRAYLLWPKDRRIYSDSAVDHRADPDLEVRVFLHWL